MFLLFKVLCFRVNRFDFESFYFLICIIRILLDLFLRRVVWLNEIRYESIWCNVWYRGVVDSCIVMNVLNVFILYRKCEKMFILL